MSVEVVTFGCRLNAYESEVIRGAAAGAAGETIVIQTPTAGGYGKPI